MAATADLENRQTRNVENVNAVAEAAIEFARQSANLGQYRLAENSDISKSSQAAEANFVTAQDAVIETFNGGRLPAVPAGEAFKLNELKDALEGRPPREKPRNTKARKARDGTLHGVGIDGESNGPEFEAKETHAADSGAPLGDTIPPSRTNPLFPPLPTYGPPSILRSLQCWVFRFSSAVLSFCFLATIILGAVFTFVPTILHYFKYFIKLQHPDASRPFLKEEQRQAALRQEACEAWNRRQDPRHTRKLSLSETLPDEEASIHGTARPTTGASADAETFVPTEGGPDRLVCDVGYYARREGLDRETYLVQTEDGFIIELWHIYNPLTYTSREDTTHQPHVPELFPASIFENIQAQGQGYAQRYPPGSKKYPVLLLHGLLQSSGAFCCSGSNSLAFYLAKAGYDVWLGNNRCGFQPRHTMLKYSDPRMWSWNIRQMGVMDLAALVSRVLFETGFEKCALVAHSQGTTQTLVALAKEQRPELGRKLSVVCLLAPAAYAGPLIGKAYFKFMRLLSPALFRLVFGIHAFIPLMMTMHKYLPGRIYGFMGYRVFSFLFSWTDKRWDRGLRNRSFLFAPVYVSSESMRWWLGRECFATQKCILSTKTETALEDEEDEAQEHYDQAPHDSFKPTSRAASEKVDNCGAGTLVATTSHLESDSTTRDAQADRGRFAWYDENAPPMAFWVAGSDELVDGRRFLRRFERGREPHVNVVHTKIIEDYEHLDVIWAINSLSEVGKEVGEVIWKTVSDEARNVCRVPQLDLDPQTIACASEGGS